MRRYLVTGASGWLAGELGRRLDSFPGDYSLDRVSVRGDKWRVADWSCYDGVFHFASAMSGGDQEGVNERLAGDVARKCADDGVRWMLVMSSFHVYGAGSDSDLLVDRETKPAPATPYGRGKLAAEGAAAGALLGTGTRLAVVRAPLVYGPGLRGGNFRALAELSGRTPLFPETRNARSMIFSQNLCELCRLLADSGEGGLYLPQDGSYFDTAELVRGLASRQGRRVRVLPGTAGLTHALARLEPRLGKLFGNARYRMEASECPQSYRVFGVEKALDLTVRGLVR